MVLASGAFLCCSRADTAQKPGPATVASVASVASVAPVERSPSSGSPDASPALPSSNARGVRMVRARAGLDTDTAALVREETRKAAMAGRELVVYVGASWCEPCRYFHQTAARGDLDREFPNLTLLEFDLDEAKEALSSAGYISQLIPLFAVPAPDGRASAHTFEGSIKGEGAVANLTPRLRELLRHLPHAPLGPKP